MTHHSKASFGKRQESIAVAKLLRRGFDVYMTLTPARPAPPIDLSKIHFAALHFLRVLAVLTVSESRVRSPARLRRVKVLSLHPFVPRPRASG